MYPAVGYPALPLCANDVQAVKKALIAGLNVSESNIWFVVIMEQRLQKT